MVEGKARNENQIIKIDVLSAKRSYLAGCSFHFSLSSILTTLVFVQGCCVMCAVHGMCMYTLGMYLYIGYVFE